MIENRIQSKCRQTQFLTQLHAAFRRSCTPSTPFESANSLTSNYLGVSLGRSTGHSPVDNSALKSLANKDPTKNATVPLVHTSAFRKPFPPLLYSNTRPLQKDIDIMRIPFLVK